IEEAVYVSDQVVLLARRPGKVHRIIETKIDRSKSPDEIRRDQNYLDYVDDIWAVLKTYLQ
ncbi:MAG: hypothetical protein WC722_17630, partial [Rhodospirillales bacterium]